MRCRHDQHQSVNAGISLLERERSDLCLCVPQAAHEFVSDGNAAAREEEIERAKVAGRTDRGFDPDLPAARFDESSILVDHLKLARITQPSAHGVQADAESHAYRSRIRSDVLDRHAALFTALNSSDLGGGEAERPCNIGLPQSGSESRLAKVAGKVDGPPAGCDAGFPNASDSVGHAAMIDATALSIGYRSGSAASRSSTTSGIVRCAHSRYAS